MSPTQNDLPSLITQVLRDELWFGDSEPVWTGLSPANTHSKSA